MTADTQAVLAAQFGHAAGRFDVLGFRLKAGPLLSGNDHQIDILIFPLQNAFLCVRRTMLFPGVSRPNRPAWERPVAPAEKQGLCRP